MSTRRVDGFFYGLFMDADVLNAYDVVPHSPRRAYVDDYKLNIGKRATLSPSAGNKAYGMVYSLTHAELDKLYSGSGLTDYKPEAVCAINTDSSENIACLCFNLLIAPPAGEVNHDYARKLQAALTKLDFPKEYVDSLM